MTYTVKKLAEISGVSIRTLRFYDEIGLLPPSRIGDNGYRYYEGEQVLRLQQILFYRELGFALSDIQIILNHKDFDKIEALKSHREALEQAVAKTRKLIATIDHTIAKLKGKNDMKDNEIFAGFSKEKQDEYERYIEGRYGDEGKQNIAASKMVTKNWSKDDVKLVQADYDRVHKDMTAEIVAGHSPSDGSVQDIVRTHFAIVSRFWKPHSVAYAGLGQLYLDHPDFRKLYDSYDPRLAEFLAEAMRIFARGLPES